MQVISADQNHEIRRLEDLIAAKMDPNLYVPC